MGCKATLGELCTFHRGASVPRARMFNSGKYLYIHYGDLYRGFEQRIDVENPAKPLPFILDSEKIKETQFLHDQDIVYVLTSETVDDLGHAFLFNNPRNRIAVSGTETTIVRIQRKDMVLPAYLNYVMQSPRFIAELRQYVRGMKVFRVHPNDVARISVDLPSLDKQAKVVAILDAIFEKRLINNQLNGYLEELADGMFRRHFGGLTDNATLADFANVTMGQSPAGSSYNEAGIGTIFYQGRAEFGWRYPTQRLSTTEPKRMAKAGDVLMSVRAPVGDLNLAYEDCCIGRGLAAIHCDYPSYGLYLMRSLHKKLDAYNGEGTVFGSINGKALNGLPIALPNNAAIRAFEKEAAPIDTQIRNNEVESRTLVTLRDTLLPKLMSGEIDVSKVDLTQLNSHLAQIRIPKDTPLATTDLGFKFDRPHYSPLLHNPSSSQQQWATIWFLRITQCSFSNMQCVFRTYDETATPDIEFVAQCAMFLTHNYLLFRYGVEYVRQNDVLFVEHTRQKAERIPGP